MALLPSNCGRCGFKGESVLFLKGPHVKQQCGNCGRYVAFLGKEKLPELVAIKQEIYRLAAADLDKIAGAKKEIGFISQTVPLKEKIQYWRLLTYFNGYWNKSKQRQVL